eukprot:SM000044S15965  [mRNA]  locus=s44:251364:253839:- [translate_table: standard]
MCGSHRAVDCSDPHILQSIVQWHMYRSYRGKRLYHYSGTVPGASPDECDIAWSLDPENSSRVDRRYRLEYNVKYNVIKEWPPGSGSNARNYTVGQFRGGKRFLVYTRSTGWCAGYNHKRWSMGCALNEAIYLNRTFVIDMEYCLFGFHAFHTGVGPRDIVVRDVRLYYNLNHLQRTVGITPYNDFDMDLKIWNLRHPDKQVTIKEVNVTYSSEDLKADDNQVVRRMFLQESDYWYNVCSGVNERVLKKQTSLVLPPKPITDIIVAVRQNLSNYDYVHVRRGDKVLRRGAWPNLNFDTQPEQIMAKLPSLGIQPGRKLYIATDELQPGFFEKLRKKYELYMLDDFSDLWAVGSPWYKATVQLVGQEGDLRFDGYMRAMVDYGVRDAAKTKVETFNDLTQDSRNGQKHRHR